MPQKAVETGAEKTSLHNKELHGFLNNVIQKKDGFKLGEPWKYSEESLAVVVPIIRENAPKRKYTTMYEVLKKMKMEDSGQIDIVKIQNETGDAVFVRTGTIFEGKTQNRAAQNSGIYNPGQSDVKVKCVHQTHGIRSGSEMKFGDIAPMSVTANLFSQAPQSDVWNSVRRYTAGDKSVHCSMNTQSETGSGYRGVRSKSFGFNDGLSSLYMDSTAIIGACWSDSNNNLGNIRGTGTDDLLAHLKMGSVALDEMMQKVPLFEHQCGAVIFNPTGVIAVETFDHPKSWESIKKEVIEKHGDKIMEEQAEHLFELKPERIVPSLKKFIEKLSAFEEHTVRKDNFSETRIFSGDHIVGEYTMVDGKVIHTIMVKAE